MAYLSATIRRGAQGIADTMPNPVSGVGPPPPPRLDALLQSIERAGADIAIDHTECGKRQGGGLLPGVVRGQHRGLSLDHPGVLLLEAQVCTKMAQGGARSVQEEKARGMTPVMLWLIRALTAPINLQNPRLNNIQNDR